MPLDECRITNRAAIDCWCSLREVNECLAHDFGNASLFLSLLLLGFWSSYERTCLTIRRPDCALGISLQLPQPQALGNGISCLRRLLLGLGRAFLDAQREVFERLALEWHVRLRSIDRYVLLHRFLQCDRLLMNSFSSSEVKDLAYSVWPPLLYLGRTCEAI